MHDLKLYNSKGSQCAFLVHLWNKNTYEIGFFKIKPSQKRPDLQRNTLYIAAIVYRPGFSDLNH